MDGTVRRLVTSTTVVLLAAVIGLVSGSHPAVGNVDADTAVPVNCEFPSGTFPVSVRFAVTLPSTAIAGQQVQPTGLRMEFSLPAKAVEDLPTTQVGAQATVVAAMRGIGARSVWRFAAAPLKSAAQPGPAPSAPTAVDSSATLAGQAPVITSALPGKLSLVATQLTLDAGSSHITCNSTDPSGVTLAAITIVDNYDKSALNRAARNGQLLTTGGSPRPKSVQKADADEDNCFDNPDATPGTAWIVAYSNVKKQNGAALVGPGLMTLLVGVRNCFFFDADGNLTRLVSYNTGHLDLPPSKATFLSFGFMPTTATMKLTQVGEASIVATLDFEHGTNTATSTMRLSLQLSDLNVNGTPLAVGPNCRASRLLDVALNGEADYSVQTGGTLGGAITIPPFTGCGVTEDLDPLLTASISGPDNFMRATQGYLCTETDPPSCPPKVPEPQR